MRPLLAVLALLAALLVTPRAHADDSDRWYILELAGQRAGWMRATERRDGDRIISTSDLQLSIKRGTTEIKIRLETEFLETAAGVPVSMRVVSAFGSAPTTVTYTFHDDRVEAVTEQPGAEASRATLPPPEGEWLPPAAAAEYVERRLEAGATEISVRTIDPSSGPNPVVFTRRVIEHTRVEALGKTLPAVKWRVSLDTMPGLDTVEYADERGLTIRSDTNLGGIAVTMLAADKDLATAGISAPELMVATLVRPDGEPIRNPRAARRAVLRLGVDDGEFPDLPTTGAQRAERLDARAQRVTIDLDAPREPLAEGETAARYLESSAVIGAADDDVARLARDARAGVDGGPAAQAEALRRFVHAYITSKTLGVGFASASEVVRTRTGDCTEHAVLLAALLRASDIPARVVSGLVYADSFAGADAVFGYHMWTQALLPGSDGVARWTDLDATLADQSPFDATHVALGASAMGEGEAQNAMVRLAPLLGRLRITVEQVHP